MGQTAVSIHRLSIWYSFYNYRTTKGCRPFQPCEFIHHSVFIHHRIYMCDYLPFGHFAQENTYRMLLAKRIPFKIIK